MTSFEVDTVSLHVHERIDPPTILSAILQRLKQGKDAGTGQPRNFRPTSLVIPLNRSAGAGKLTRRLRTHPHAYSVGARSVNAALKGSGVKIPVTEGARKGQVVIVLHAGKKDVSAETSTSSKQSFGAIDVVFEPAQVLDRIGGHGRAGSPSQ